MSVFSKQEIKELSLKEKIFKKLSCKEWKCCGKKRNAAQALLPTIEETAKNVFVDGSFGRQSSFSGMQS